ncbi:hypothetical protein M422DRAFT_269676 [Sphaerobolus stellatus SS14]|uniref:Uncharacterized protein n=1 Tax=Sphaerobolus stellatus (strain SS14) TaxID=990650 RepID=A0A0C9UJA3_SPHS4|nr:hypothetical protein M422DRAFT_269676 [Sphaerobolus stellatus SS14]
MPGGRPKKYTPEEAHEARKASKRRYYAKNTSKECSKANIRSRCRNPKKSDFAAHTSPAPQHPETAISPVNQQPTKNTRIITSKYMTIGITTDLDDALEDVVTRCRIISDQEEWAAFLQSISDDLIGCAETNGWEEYQPTSAALVHQLV